MPRPPAPGPAAVKAAGVLDRRLDPASRAPLALALSGGGDSLALLRIAAPWAAAHGRPLLAFTVDHGLNPDSARWTAIARDAARDAGAGWRGLAWRGEKPATGLPAAARAARHRLLAETAREVGARVILMGHTLDDVEEGEHMRAADAPGLGRLRDWAPSPAWPEGRGVFLLRPLLEVRRAELRDLLRAEGLTWIDDPANTDPRYARTRARARLREGPPVPVSPPPARRESDWRVTDDGRVMLRRGILDARLLSAALLCAGGGDTPPRGPRLARLMDRLAGVGPVDATLAGARLRADADAVEIGREAGERTRGGLAPVALAPGVPAVWDGRYEVVADAPGLTAGPLAGRVAGLSKANRAALRAFPPAARSALPVLTDGDGAAALPRPFGAGPARARSLVGERLAGACGDVTREADLGG